MNEQIVAWSRLLLFAAATTALVATSAPEEDDEYRPFESWERAHANGQLSLSPDEVRRVLRFRVVPARSFSDAVSISFAGDLRWSTGEHMDADPLAAFVDVELSSSVLSGDLTQTVVTRFELQSQGTLPVYCSTSLDGCAFEIDVRFSRQTSNARAVDVAWSLVVSGFGLSEQGDAGGQLDWTIELLAAEDGPAPGDGGVSDAGAAGDAGAARSDSGAVRDGGEP